MKKIQTKEKLYRAALELFTQQGIDKTTTSQISEKAGVGAGTLFVYFKTKCELINSLYIDLKNKFFENACTILESSDTVENTIKNLARYFIEYAITHYKEYLYINLREIDPLISEDARATFKACLNGLNTKFEMWHTSGVLKDLENYPRIFMTLVDTAVEQVHESGSSTINPQLIDMIWDALKR